MKILITGGLGFIGSNLIKKLIKNKKNYILNIDSKTDVAMPESLYEVSKQKNYNFVKTNICNKNQLKNIIFKFKPQSVIHLAAESHVDKSISGPEKFIQTNIYGTYNLINLFNFYLEKNKHIKKNFKFIHVSTDEVYGSLKKSELPFNENSVYKPNSPYSASKASSDYLVRSWIKTYKFPAIITHCSNNYGPWQFPEKLIPVIISKCLNNKKIPIYGNGKNIRDWIYVEDHVRALELILSKGLIGETYNIGSNCEITNINLTLKICSILDKIIPKNKSYTNQINFVKDRLGHDQRYAIDNKKIKKNLKFKPIYNLEKGLNKTIHWYIDNKKWLNNKTKNQ